MLHPICGTADAASTRQNMWYTKSLLKLQLPPLSSSVIYRPPVYVLATNHEPTSATDLLKYHAAARNLLRVVRCDMARGEA